MRARFTDNALSRRARRVRITNRRKLSLAFAFLYLVIYRQFNSATALGFTNTMRYLPESLVASLGAGNAVLLALAEQSPQTIVTLTGLTVTLGGCLVWVIKHVLGKTIPLLHQQHAANVERLCAAFEERGKEDRESCRESNREVAGAVAKVADAVEKLEVVTAESRDSVRELIYRQEPSHAIRPLVSGPIAADLNDAASTRR